jgi:hypothetical protein
MSLYDAFGLAFLVKIFSEIKNISTAVMIYLTESTFYQYLGSIFNISKEDQSVRDKYKKPVEYDWKAEYEKEQRKREWDEWRNRNIYNKHDNEDNREINTNLIIVTILALGGSIAIWYYGKDALDILTPIWNLGTLITGILRGEGPDDGNNNNLAPPAPPAPVAPPAPPAPPMPSTPQDIELVDKKGDNRPESPDAMMVYASDMVNRNVAPTGPTETTPSKSESITKDGKIIKPPLSKNEAKPMTLLESLKEGKKLKHTPIESKDKSKKNVSEGSSLMQALSNKFDQISKNIKDEDETIVSDWEDNAPTPTNNQFESPRSDKAELGIVMDKKGKNKFLEAISREETKQEISEIVDPKISKTIDTMQKVYPNINPETIALLKTTKGLKARNEIIAAIPDNELVNKELMAKAIASENSDGANSQTDKMKFLLGLKNKAQKIKEMSENEIIKTEKDERIITKIDEIIYKNRNLESLDQFLPEDKELILFQGYKLKPDKLIESLNKIPNYRENRDIDRAIGNSIDFQLNEIKNKYPYWNKQEIVSELLSNNPNQKNEILDRLKDYVDNIHERLEEKLTPEQMKNVREVLVEEDLNEIEHISANRTIEQIKTSASINQTHKNILKGILLKFKGVILGC